MVDVEIAILGAGFSGSALAIQLHRLSPPGTTIALVDDAPALGRGLAYGTTNPAHLLNVVAGRMSLFPDRPTHFRDWLLRHHREDLGLDLDALSLAFAPRRWYGDYLGEQIGAAVTATSGPTIIPIAARASGLQPRGDSWRISLADDSQLDAGTVVLCTGNLASRLPVPVNAVDPGATDRLIDDPWRDPRMNQIASEETVLWIGTGLTMVDQVLERETRGHAGRSIAISRRGLLPNAHVATPREPVTLSPQYGKRSVLTMLAAFRQCGPDTDWRQIVDGLRPYTQQLWLESSLVDRQRFLRHLAPYWGVVRHRMAPQIDQQIASIRQERRLDVVAGRIRQIESGSRQDLRVIHQPKEQSCAIPLDVDWVINCSGPERNVERTSDPLLLSLVASGIARGDALQLGLDTTETNAVIARDGVAWPNLFALGPLTMGRLWEIVAVPDLRVQCATMAEHLASA